VQTDVSRGKEKEVTNCALEIEEEKGKRKGMFLPVFQRLQETSRVSGLRFVTRRKGRGKNNNRSWRSYKREGKEGREDEV